MFDKYLNIAPDYDFSSCTPLCLTFEKSLDTIFKKMIVSESSTMPSWWIDFHTGLP